MIRKRLIVAFMTQLIVVLLFSGFFLQYHLQNVLEQEIGEKLQTLAAAVATQMDASLLRLLAPGDEGTRLQRGLQQRLTSIAQASRLRRIMVFSDQGKVWLDSEGLAPIGSIYVRYEFDRTEITLAKNGIPTSSVLFSGSDGGLYKSGYAPLYAEENVVGIVVAEGSAQSMQAVRDMQRTLLQIGVAAAFGSLLLAGAVSWRLTKPILTLQKEAKRIAKGDMGPPIPVVGNNEIAFLASTMEDMRRAILQREEQQKLMLAGVAHEIRNPLGGIELFAGLLRDDLTDDALRQKADRILLESKNLKNLVQHFLDYAKPAIPKPESCSIRDILLDCRDLLHNELTERDVRLICEGDGCVLADPQHVKQMLLNLLLNGLQAMDNGGELHVQIYKRNSQIAVEVIDQGHGIMPAEQEKIFEPFFSRREKGLGLGLPMVKNLAEANGGSVHLMHSDTHGSRFRLMLPAAVNMPGDCLA